MHEFTVSDKHTTADIGLELKASSIEELFLAAAEGMMVIIFGSSIGGKPETTIDVSMQATGKEELLVDWLSELLYLFDADRLMPVSYEIKIGSNREALEAQVGFRRYNKRDKAEHEIKAVTYYKLNIVKIDDLYQCHLVFDL